VQKVFLWEEVVGKVCGMDITKIEKKLAELTTKFISRRKNKGK